MSVFFLLHDDIPVTMTSLAPPRPDRNRVLLRDGTGVGTGVAEALEVCSTPVGEVSFASFLGRPRLVIYL